jgi:hypothetical protein
LEDSGRIGLIREFVVSIQEEEASGKVVFDGIVLSIPGVRE